MFGLFWGFSCWISYNFQLGSHRIVLWGFPLFLSFSLLRSFNARREDSGVRRCPFFESAELPKLLGKRLSIDFSGVLEKSFKALESLGKLSSGSFGGSFGKVLKGFSRVFYGFFQMGVRGWVLEMGLTGGLCKAQLFGLVTAVEGSWGWGAFEFVFLFSGV